MEIYENFTSLKAKKFLLIFGIVTENKWSQ